MAGEYDETALVADLQLWWDDQVEPKDDPFADKPLPSGTIFDVLPAVDSLGVVAALVTLEKHVGFKVPPKIIKRGGYADFNEMTADLLPKVKDLVAKQAAKPGAGKPDRKAA